MPILLPTTMVRALPTLLVVVEGRQLILPTTLLLGIGVISATRALSPPLLETHLILVVMLPCAVWNKG